jgi:hypothetical protein
MSRKGLDPGKALTSVAMNRVDELQSIFHSDGNRAKSIFRKLDLVECEISRVPV